ncbi:universal stress protein [Streptomyces sp. NPDC053427]|uniref:universal stress protein n=1 Tax=Streptomyces sp. NPDC053427 TaxID=3365701 RepID=UPI0037CDB111
MRAASASACAAPTPGTAMAMAPGLSAAMVETTSQIAEDIVTQVREGAERLGNVFRVRWEFHTVEGDAFGGLVRVADELKADAVVVGASEHAGHRFIGSLAVRLVKAARWPVTVVP